MRWTVGVAAFVVGSLFACLIWPTRWHYQTEYRTGKAGIPFPVEIRVDRFSGVRQTKLPEGWVDGDVIFD